MTRRILHATLSGIVAASIACTGVYTVRWAAAGDGVSVVTGLLLAALGGAAHVVVMEGRSKLKGEGHEA